METTLNITNGDSAVNLMRKGKIPGDFLPWRDVLHEGPVPADLPLKALTAVRARFIIDRGWAEAETVVESFEQRDDVLESFRNYEKVVLWFEHDLYDQLQLLQILDWFNLHSGGQCNLQLICTENYLGLLSPEKLSTLAERSEPVTATQLRLATKAWSAFRAKNPQKWRDLLDIDTCELPFLKDAVLRLLEEYPGCTDGLSRTARQALQLLAAGAKSPGRLFGDNQQLEERIFLGDTVFWNILGELLQATPPLIALPEGITLTTAIAEDIELKITQAGLKLLAGKIHWHKTIVNERWIGGVHLNLNTMWCWNSASMSLIQIPCTTHD